jgi:hypothetical protein
MKTTNLHAIFVSVPTVTSSWSSTRHMQNENLLRKGCPRHAQPDSSAKLGKASWSSPRQAPFKRKVSFLHVEYNVILRSMSIFDFFLFKKFLYKTRNKLWKHTSSMRIMSSTARSGSNQKTSLQLASSRRRRRLANPNAKKIGDWRSSTTKSLQHSISTKQTIGSPSANKSNPL